MKQELVKKSITLPCCACSGKVTFESPPMIADAQPTFFHTMPYCDRFDRTNTAEDLLGYMRDCKNATRN